LRCDVCGRNVGRQSINARPGKLCEQKPDALDEEQDREEQRYQAKRNVGRRVHWGDRDKIFLGVRKFNNSERSTQQIIVMPGGQALSLKTHPFAFRKHSEGHNSDTGGREPGKKPMYDGPIHKQDERGTCRSGQLGLAVRWTLWAQIAMGVA
jgi:hypothetical protein